MPDRIEFEIDAGLHARRHCPVWTPVPAGLDRPSLLQEGKARPVACQLESSSNGDNLWWIVDGLAAHSIRKYTLWAEDRQRLPPPRVSLASKVEGWRVTVRRQRFAELLCPEEGAPRLTLRPVRNKLAEFTIRSAPIALHRFREFEPVVREGPVFASLEVAYSLVDRMDRTMGREVHRFRFHDGSHRFSSLDWSITLEATTGSMFLAGADAAAPVLEAGFQESTRLIAGSGWEGADELDGRAAPQLLAMDAERVTAVFARSDSAGFPPRWILRDPGWIEAAPNYESSKGRLSLGDSLALHFRIAVFPVLHARRTAAQRYMDFDCPPAVLTPYTER
jgi:hypothetical protein